MEITQEGKDWIKNQIYESPYLHVTDVSDSDSLSKTLNMDSLDKIELIMHIEKHFNITITDDESNDIKTLQDIYNLIAYK